MFLYSAVSSPLDRSKRFTLFLPWQTCSLRHQLGFSWKHSSHAAIAQRLFTHISTTVYSQVLIYTAESTEASWRERKCPNFETVAKGDSKPGSLDCESGILPLSYRAPRTNKTVHKREKRKRCPTSCSTSDVFWKLNGALPLPPQVYQGSYRSWKILEFDNWIN